MHGRTVELLVYHLDPVYTVLDEFGTGMKFFPFRLFTPQALVKKIHGSHYMKGLHEVVHRDEQAQGFMGFSQRKLRSAWEIVCRFLQNSSVSCKSFSRHIF
jgi:hypothetical protein